jgi:hypothetical protein
MLIYKLIFCAIARDKSPRGWDKSPPSLLSGGEIGGMNGIAPLHQPCGEGTKGTKVKHRTVTRGNRIGAGEAARLKLLRGFFLNLGCNLVPGR